LALERSNLAAKRLLMVSIIYAPVAFCLIMLDKVWPATGPKTVDSPPGHLYRKEPDQSMAENMLTRSQARDLKRRAEPKESQQMKIFTPGYASAFAVIALGLTTGACQQAAPPAPVASNPPATTSSTVEHTATTSSTTTTPSPDSTAPPSQTTSSETTTVQKEKQQ
jgi:hypothetical protein